MKLGRLKSVGIDEPWKVPLYLPTGYTDCRNVYKSFNFPYMDDQQIVVIGRYEGDFSTEWRKGRNGGKRMPFTKGSISDTNGTLLKFSIFGDPRSLEKYLKQNQNQVSLTGIISLKGGIPFLNNPTPIADEHIGNIVPNYPGKAGVLSKENALRTISSLLEETVPLAANKLHEQVQPLLDGNTLQDILKCPNINLEETLHCVHYPKTYKEADEANYILEKISAIISVSGLKDSCAIPKVSRKPINIIEWKTLLEPVAFNLTDEQTSGIEHLISSFSKPYTSNTLINADVGMGKSIIYQVAIIAAVKVGARAAILLPNERLAQQAFNEINTLWPEVDVTQVNKKTAHDLTNQTLMIGTTALLFRNIGSLDICVTDEQHRFSVGQRKHLSSDKTHIIELSATPIPRTQAMLIYGSVNVIRLTKRHCIQDIQTKITPFGQARQMVNHVVNMKSKGSKLLIVCPRKEQRQDEDDVEEYSIPSVHQVAEKWERLFPGDVRVVHSDTPTEVATQNLVDINSGKAHILISTTVIEVGITIQDLRALIVVHAERFGMAQLHQLRGRLSRHGGYGVCYLYIPKPVKEKTMARLNAVASSNDGFKLSELDMKIRGVGDLSKLGSKQHGSADNIIFNKKVSVELIAEMMDALAK